MSFITELMSDIDFHAAQLIRLVFPINKNQIERIIYVL